MDEPEPAKRVTFEVTASPATPRIRGEHYSGTAAALAMQLAQLDMSALNASVAALLDGFALAFKPRPGGPAEAEVEFGLKISAEGGVIVSKLGGEMSMRVKVKWDRS